MTFFNQEQMRIRRDFIQAHGGDGIAVTSGDFFLFPDGAMASRGMDAMVLEPPTDQINRLKLIIEYHEKALACYEEAFLQLKSQILATFDGPDKSYVGLLYNGSQEQAMEELKATQAKVKRLRTRWKEAKAQLEKLTSPSPEELRIQAKIDAQIANRKKNFRDAVKRIKV